MPTSSIFDNISISPEYAEKFIEEYTKNMERPIDLAKQRNHKSHCCHDPEFIRSIIETNLRKAKRETTNNYTDKNENNCDDI